MDGSLRNALGTSTILPAAHPTGHTRMCGTECGSTSTARRCGGRLSVRHTDLYARSAFAENCRSSDRDREHGPLLPLQCPGGAMGLGAARLIDPALFGYRIDVGRHSRHSDGWGGDRLGKDLVRHHSDACLRTARVSGFLPRPRRCRSEGQRSKCRECSRHTPLSASPSAACSASRRGPPRGRLLAPLTSGRDTLRGRCGTHNLGPVLPRPSRRSTGWRSSHAGCADDRTRTGRPWVRRRESRPGRR